MTRSRSNYRPGVDLLEARTLLTGASSIAPPGALAQPHLGVPAHANAPVVGPQAGGLAGQAVPDHQTVAGRPGSPTAAAGHLTASPSGAASATRLAAAAPWNAG